MSWGGYNDWDDENEERRERNYAELQAIRERNKRLEEEKRKKERLEAENLAKEKKLEKELTRLDENNYQPSLFDLEEFKNAGLEEEFDDENSL